MKRPTPLLVVMMMAMMVMVSMAYVIPVHHHIVPAKSIRVRTAKGPFVFPLQGDIDRYAEYFVNITLGTPPQTFRVQVDSGSTDLVVFGTDCDGCPKANNVTYYNMAKSKTGEPIECDDDDYDCDVNNCWDDDYCPLEIEYGGGGSLNGYAAQDIFQIGNLSVRPSFGVVQQLSGPFENLGVDGCWGFASEDLSSWGDGPVIDHMAFDLKIYDSFSLCLRPDNGIMDIGTNYQGDSRFEWTDVSGDDWYTVEMEDFFINNQSLGLSRFSLNEDGVIVDSGTTLFIVTSKMMKVIQARLLAMCDTVNLVGICNTTSKQTMFDGYCFPMTDDQVALYPNISTTLKGISPLVMQPQDYLWEGAGEAGVWCFGIQEIEGGGVPVILGDVILQNYHVAFDRDKKKVGWGPLSSCPSSE
eukprot:TRINITY_DN1995_c0_g1_i1.p1 TRINITY_DN1995_c0_g1~~TRINITY_DN1995_c0_g1_i1.p1  ORF type:complete len:413 (-),score=127.06 TRINITY_DN1995_c0_g1_i1:8-1246(-)